MVSYRFKRKEEFAPGIKYYVGVEFLNNIRTNKDEEIPQEEAFFEELFYYEGNDTFWVPTGSENYPDTIINSW